MWGEKDDDDDAWCAVIVLDAAVPDVAPSIGDAGGCGDDDECTASRFSRGTGSGELRCSSSPGEDCSGRACVSDPVASLCAPSVVEG